MNCMFSFLLAEEQTLKDDQKIRFSLAGQFPGPWHPSQPSLLLKAHTGAAPCSFLDTELEGCQRGIQRDVWED